MLRPACAQMHDGPNTIQAAHACPANFPTVTMKPRTLLLLASGAVCTIAANMVAAGTAGDRPLGVILMPPPVLMPPPPILLEPDDGGERGRRSDGGQQRRGQPRESKPASAAAATGKA